MLKTQMRGWMRKIRLIPCSQQETCYVAKQDPEQAEIITHLSTGELIISDKSARKVVMVADRFTLDDGVLWYFYCPISRHGKRRLIPLRQLCIPLTLRLDILKSFHEQGSTHKCTEALRQFDKNILGFIYIPIRSSTVNKQYPRCSRCLMAKKRTHLQRNPLHCLESHGFWDKILVDISGPLKTDSQGHRYCLMVTESLDMHVILFPLKCVAAEAVASALYTHVFTKRGYVIQYNSQIEGARSEAPQSRP